MLLLKDISGPNHRSDPQGLLVARPVEVVVVEPTHAAAEDLEVATICVKASSTSGALARLLRLGDPASAGSCESSDDGGARKSGSDEVPGSGGVVSALRLLLL